MSHSAWVADRLPTADDGDLEGLVRWGPLQPGLLIYWSDVRPGESWAHTSAWRPQQEGPGRE